MRIDKYLVIFLLLIPLVLGIGYLRQDILAQISLYCHHLMFSSGGPFMGGLSSMVKTMVANDSRKIHDTDYVLCNVG